MTYPDTERVLDTLLKTDAYKLDHRRAYPPGTQIVFSNLTARGSRIEGIDHTVFFGLQAWLTKFQNGWDEFFALDQDGLTEVLDGYERVVNQLLGTESFDTNHFRDLHELGHMPLRIRAFREGSLVPVKVPYLTIENTDERFAWLTNYFETELSAELWQPITAATLSWHTRRLLNERAVESGADLEDIPFQGHDFSYRGMEGTDAAAASSAAHLLSFVGTDTLPSIRFVEKFYTSMNPETGLSTDVNAPSERIASSVMATEHSVMMADGEEGEFGTYERLIDQYPTGTLAIVSDTWNIWRVIHKYASVLKDKIVARDGRLMVRPDCYDDETSILTPRGWVLFSELEDNDKVAQVHSDGTYTFVNPIKRTRMDYNGLMVAFTDRHGKCDLLVTPNHRMLWNRRRGDRVVEAGMSNVGSAESKMYRSAAARNYGRKLSHLDRFKIAFQADGSYPSKHVEASVSGERSYRFNFAKSRKLDRLKDICESGGFRYSVHDEPARSGQKTVYVWLPSNILITKDFSWVDIANLCGNWCRGFVEELSYWDATRRSDGRFKFDTTHAKVASVVELIAVSAGYGVLKSTYPDERKPHFSDTHCLHIMKDNLLGGQAIEKKYKWYTGEIHCVTVPTGMLFVKRGRGTAVCGNSGDPIKILLGDPDAAEGTPERVGVVDALWDVFGGTVNEKGFRVLDPHIGVVYGDGITFERADAITRGLIDKGYVSTTVVLGFGSFTFQYQTRDTFNMAMKATWVKIDGEGRGIVKNPITDNGTKKSAKGRLAVRRWASGLPYLIENPTAEQEAQQDLTDVYFNGDIVRYTDFKTVRKNLKNDTVLFDRYRHGAVPPERVAEIARELVKD